jgi:hypothetical protein
MTPGISSVTSSGAGLERPYHEAQRRILARSASVRPGAART